MPRLTFQEYKDERTKYYEEEPASPTPPPTLPPSIPKPRQQCTQCNKSFINLKQHVTKSHNKILIELRSDGFDDSTNKKKYKAVKIENGMHEEGEAAAEGDDDNGWFNLIEWYKDDESISLRVYQNDTWNLERYGDLEYSMPLYTHNIQVVYKTS